jgi:hypothetical protein
MFRDIFTRLAFTVFSISIHTPLRSFALLVSSALISRDPPAARVPIPVSMGEERRRALRARAVTGKAERNAQ